MTQTSLSITLSVRGHDGCDTDANLFAGGGAAGLAFAARSGRHGCRWPDLTPSLDWRRACNLDNMYV